MGTELKSSTFDTFAKAHGLRFALLFGSRATGKATEVSDYDVALLYSDSENFYRLYDEALDLASQSLGAPKEKIDLADLGRENILLRYNVTRASKLLYGDPYAYAEYQAFAFREYHDAKGLFNLERRAVENRQTLLIQQLATL